MIKSLKCLPLFTLCAAVVVPGAHCLAEPPSGRDWVLVFEDDFDYPDDALEVNWISENRSNAGHILSSRWRENAVVSEGTLKLVARKEKRGGQEWTAGNIWTRAIWKYGYFECRYKYAAASGTNNSFWLMTQKWQNVPEQDGVKRFEIDINEGHYPDEINMNLHNYTDVSWSPNSPRGRNRPNWPKSYTLSSRSDSRADREVILDIPVQTTKLRFSTKHDSYFHLRSLRVFPKKMDGNYPSPYVDKLPDGLVDYAREANVRHSRTFDTYAQTNPPEAAVDGNISTSWISLGQGEAVYELDFGDEPREVGCVQFVTGWNNPAENGYTGYINDYCIEYWNGNDWVEIASLDDNVVVDKDLSEEFHTYALEWNEDELIWYFDGKEIRRLKNYCAFYESPVWLSLAITYGSGKVGPEVDGTQMEVDYVKIWQERGKETVQDESWLQR
ncbi:family 16 glycosylhydrolase [Ruficoccus amylovorans]|uniref:Family 16 glycosylhydrolase n=1 Tax=Ruficoccus amylovorans TaxID=1804625 RepID=A0A842HK99_9BACT|nr:family 16 glycosylhydrolase [Ruficoccus amylovorans]MBC2595907.1 family 16 glycosylhydrolase [Ruficoccus amylovorans]